MIRTRVAIVFSHAFQRLAIPFLLLGLLFGLTLPSLHSRSTYISEGSLKVGSFARSTQELSLSTCTKRQINQTKIIRGSRSTGSDAFVILVARNTFSMTLASCLLQMIQSRRFLTVLSFEIAVLVDDVSSVKTVVGEKRVRGALVLNISSEADDVCLETHGSSGLLPNLDLVNVVVKMTRASGMDISVCDSRTDSSNDASSFANYLVDTITSHRNSIDQLRQAGVHSVGLFGRAARLPNLKSSSLMRRLVGTVEGTLRAINNLEERLHHSYAVWFFNGIDQFVDFEVAQHVVSLCVLSALAQLFYRRLKRPRESVTGLVAAEIIGLLIGYCPSLPLRLVAAPVCVFFLSRFIESSLLLLVVSCFLAVLTVLHPPLSIVASLLCSSLLMLLPSLVVHRLWKVLVLIIVSPLLVVSLTDVDSLEGQAEWTLRLVGIPLQLWLLSRTICY